MDWMIWVLAAAGTAIGFLLGTMRSRQSHTRLERELAMAVRRDDYDAALREKTVLLTRLEAANDDKDTANDTLEETRRELLHNRERAVLLQAEKSVLEQQLNQQKQELEKTQERLRLEFKNTATVLFEEMSTKFSTHSEKKIGDLLDPMQKHLNEFKKLVVESFTTQGKEQHTLKSEIDKMVLQTDSLTKALRGDVKAQGNWGEVMLERILEESGLQKGIGYIVQGEQMGLTTADGNRQQPDVIVILPDNKHIIIDAKVSLVAYERYCCATDEASRELHLRDFLKSIRAHVTGLEQRRYQDNDKLSTPDLVFMFMPIEGAFSFAMQEDRELHIFAWNKRIVLVSPTMLFSNLRTIASIWRIERQNRYSQEIARQGGALYDKFAGFIEDMQGIGRQVISLQKSYDGAMNKLHEGRGNLVNSAEKLKQLGAKASKSLPRELIGELDDLAEEDNVLAISSLEG